MKKVSISLKEQKEKTSYHDISNNQLIHRNQISYINQILLDQDFNEKKQIEKQIKQKLTGYKAQDNKKSIFNKDNFISYQETVDLLVKSKLICHYCGLHIFILYKYQKEPKQWTLDRIHNDHGHNNNNVVISCLDCNLRRGRLNKDSFLFTKRMNIVKTF